MSLRAPLAVPVEIRVESDAGVRRVFRLAASVGEDGVRLVRYAPFEIGRPVRVRFTLPLDVSEGPLALDAEVLHADHEDETQHEGAGGCELTFLHPSAEARLAIRGYVRARLDLPA
jgi:PilZ domain